VKENETHVGRNEIDDSRYSRPRPWSCGRRSDLVPAQPHDYQGDRRHYRRRVRPVRNLGCARVLPPLHVHHREDESFWVLAGEFTMQCGDRTFRGGPGAYFFLPRGVPHTFVNDGTTPGHLLTLLTPGGSEAAFVEGGRPAEHDGLPSPGPIDVEKLQRIGRKYGHEIVGPPLSPARG
jgi:mannose-6-phosphate isomerase-like protein (cupin superfamily)